MTSIDFPTYSWHDNIIHGLRLVIGDHQHGDWRSELVLDIDHIIAWTCATEERGKFKVAPATLTFNDTTDLCISIDCGDTGGQVALHDLSIDRITREQISNQKVCLDRPYYRWRIELNWPKGGVVSFAASGVTQVLRAEPIVSESVRLRDSHRLG